MKSVRATLAKAFGNRPEDKSGAQGLPPSPKFPDLGTPRKLTRLRRMEQRVLAIKIECEDYMAKHGEEPSHITRIYQWAKGDYDV